VPISNTKDVIPFVNQLETKLIEVEAGLTTWAQNRSQILDAIPQVERNRVSAISAIVKAEDALAEINTATYGVVAAKGQRLKKLLDDLKKQVVEIAQNAGGGGGSVPKFFSDEINNAISQVDSVVPDGLKLDYRLRKIQEMSSSGGAIGDKEIIMPFKHEVTEDLTTTTVQVPEEDGVEFVVGEVTVMESDGVRGILDEAGNMITGAINASGNIVLSSIPNKPVLLYFPVRLKFKDVPDNFLMLLVETVISKSSPLMELILKLEKMMNDLADDIFSMKGSNWTADFSIMRNHQDLVKESITPKGLTISVQSGLVHATWAYNDHPSLSHFIVEKWDKDTNGWVAYDGEAGVVGK
jgi:hypothetical protein